MAKPERRRRFVINLMVRHVLRYLPLVAVLLLLLSPARVFAQSGIAGSVRDATGAVLPGVTVEASSPALIEKLRTAVTDSSGLYSIVDLRPGVYAVTFTLAGFRPVRREDLQLPASFTATVNAEMQIGAVEETITVSGQSCPSRIRGQAATGSWTRSLQWETQRTWLKSAGTGLCPLAKVCGVWPSNAAWLRAALY